MMTNRQTSNRMLLLAALISAGCAMDNFIIGGKPVPVTRAPSRWEERQKAAREAAAADLTNPPADQKSEGGNDDEPLDKQSLDVTCQASELEKAPAKETPNPLNQTVESMSEEKSEEMQEKADPSKPVKGSESDVEGDSAMNALAKRLEQSSSIPAVDSWTQVKNLIASLLQTRKQINTVSSLKLWLEREISYTTFTDKGKRDEEFKDQWKEQFRCIYDQITKNQLVWDNEQIEQLASIGLFSKHQNGKPISYWECLRNLHSKQEDLKFDFRSGYQMLVRKTGSFENPDKETKNYLDILKNTFNDDDVRFSKEMPSHWKEPVSL